MFYIIHDLFLTTLHLYLPRLNLTFDPVFVCQVIVLLQTFIDLLHQGAQVGAYQLNNSPPKASPSPQTSGKHTFPALKFSI